MDCGIFDFIGVHVIVGTDTQAFIRYANKHFAGTGFVFDHERCAGRVLRHKGYWPILWMPRRPRTAREWGTLSHEIFHLVYAILSYAGIVLSGESEETFAYLTSHLINQFVKKCK